MSRGGCGCCAIWLDLTCPRILALVKLSCVSLICILCVSVSLILIPISFLHMSSRIQCIFLDVSVCVCLFIFLCSLTPEVASFLSFVRGSYHLSASFHLFLKVGLEHRRPFRGSCSRWRASSRLSCGLFEVWAKYSSLVQVSALKRSPSRLPVRYGHMAAD